MTQPSNTGDDKIVRKSSKTEPHTGIGDKFQDSGPAPDSGRESGTDSVRIRTARSMETTDTSAAEESGMLSEGDVQNTRSSSSTIDGNR